MSASLHGQAASQTFSVVDESAATLLRGYCDQPEVVLGKLVPGLVGQLTLPGPLPLPEQLQLDSELCMQRYDGITMLRKIPLFVSHDHPTHSIYRMCEFIAADESNQLMLEVQYFSKRLDWILAKVPNPCDDCRERQALFASVVESLVLAFSYKASLGVERGGKVMAQPTCPSWVSDVGPLDQVLVLTQEDEWFFEGSDDPFSRRNIRANAGNIFSF